MRSALCCRMNCDLEGVVRKVENFYSKFLVSTKISMNTQISCPKPCSYGKWLTIKFFPSYFRSYIKSCSVKGFLLGHKYFCPSCFLCFFHQAETCSMYIILCALSVPLTSLLHGLSWEVFPSIIQILHLQLGLCHLSCAKVSIRARQPQVCETNSLLFGTLGKTWISGKETWNCASYT